MKRYTIFSIDREYDEDVREAFEVFFEDTVGTVSRLVRCVGSYKGILETSWICSTNDFNNFIWGTKWVANQESVLLVSACNKQYASLMFSDFSKKDASVDTLSLGSLKSVDAEEAMKHDAWTYRPDLGIYWIAVKGNPDTVPPQSGWQGEKK